MTTPTYPVPNPAAPSRPVAVTASSILLYIVVAVQLLDAVLAVAMMDTVVEAYREVLEQDSQIADAGPFIQAVLVLTAVVYALIAVGLAILAVFNNKGKNASRIITWVFAGLGLCCNVVGLGGTVSSAAVTGAGSGSVSQTQVDAQVAAALPGWYDAVGLATAAVTVLALLAAIILLALPSSNAYFRRPVQWTGALPFPQYPGQPGYPGHPGQQPGYPGYSGQQPGHPGYPGQQPGYPGHPGAQAGYPGQPYAAPGQSQQPYGQPGYPPAAPGSPSHFGSPQQYGQPGEPAPGLPPYPGQAGTPTPGAPAPGGPPAPELWSAPHTTQPSYDPWGPPAPTSAPPTPAPPASAPPASPPASPPDSSPSSTGGDQGGDAPPRPPHDPA